MTEITTPGASAPAPGGDGGVVSAPAPVTPQAPAPAPQAASSTTPAPGTTQPTDSNQPAAPVASEQTPEQIAEAQEADEWADAEKEIFPGLKSTQKKEPKKNEPAEPDEKTTTQTTTQDPSKKQEPPKPSDETDDQGKSQEAPDTAARSARDTARQVAQQQQEMISDVRTKMFANIPDTLVDADGDPINSLEDVQRLINPQTGEPFTEAEAGSWLLSAQQQFNQQKAAAEKQIEGIADLNLSIKDQADTINFKYGEYLKANPEVRDQLWTKFNESIVKDEASGIITSMPMSLETFYEAALGPRVAADQAKVAQDAAAVQQQQQAQAQAAANAKVAKQQQRSDRSDIYQPPTDTNKDPEADEWAAAEQAVFGNQLKK